MQRILLVYKDHSLRKAVWLLLVKMGYDVVEAANGIEAEKLQRCLPADVLMTDITTLRRSDSVGQFRRRHPQVQILGTTGISAADICAGLGRAWA